MKNQLIITAFVLSALTSMAQNKNKKIGLEGGAFIQQYNGNLGNSFFKFNTTAFCGFSAKAGFYLTKSFDVNVGGTIGHFGYCQTEEDKKRVVPINQKCPGCPGEGGMGELRAMMISGNIDVKYKFANGIFLKETSKIAPYIYVGAGINRLSDVMRRNCVNVGNHFSVNAGAGVKYNFNERFNIGYNLAVGCFVTNKHVYSSNGIKGIATETAEATTGEEMKMANKRDLYMQNAVTFGINF
ncbi:MAG: outer membrane beta-barrel protein [Bacteroidota bacterium]